jgi:hypothetical protein
MSITTVDYGPALAQTVAQARIREEVARYFWGLQRFNLDVAVADYIIGLSATWAELQLPNPMLPKRLCAVEQAKRWIDGYLQWYDAAAPHLRNNTANQPVFGQMFLDGSLIEARRLYRHIPWDGPMIADVRSLWNHTYVNDVYPNNMLERVNMNMMGEVINTWQTITFHGFQLRMPCNVTKSGVTLTLGAEIVYDWLEPPDVNHGHPMTTIRRLRGMASPQHLRKDRDNSGSRKSYSILAAAEWIFVLDGPAQNTVITFYKRTRI